MTQAKKPIKDGKTSEGDTYNPGGQAGEPVEGGGQHAAGKPGGPTLGGSAGPDQTGNEHKGKHGTRPDEKR